MSYNLTGQKVSFTYGRLVQVASGSYYDGFGNLLSIGSESIVGFATTGSNIFIGDQIVSGSIIATNGVTASLQGTSSYSNNSNNSNSSSHALSSSYAVTASYAEYARTSFASLNAQDTLIYVKNTSGTAIPKGKVVRITGADNSANFGTIGLADYLNDNNSANTLGFTNEAIDANAFGYVMTDGYLLNVNTSGFSSGDLLFLSSSGSYTSTVPIAPKHAVRLGQVIRVQSNNGSIYVRIDNGYELGELHDIIDSSTTSSYGDLLIKSGSIWTNSKHLTGDYILSGSLKTEGNISASAITASLSGSDASITTLTASNCLLNNAFIMPYSSSTRSLTPVVATGSIYLLVGASDLLYVYDGTRWTSSSLA